MILMIDNYDSFTYNLVQYFGELGVEMEVYHHDEISLEEVGNLNPENIVISPGPGTPEKAGISKQRLVIDPGFGFGKSLEHNVALLEKLNILVMLDVPLLVGISRKSMLGAILARSRNETEMVAVEERLFASVGAAVVAAMHGARIIRVHDVRATVEALAPFNSILNG